MTEFRHETVLLVETVDALRPGPGGTYIDCTLGGAGHSRLILERSGPSGKLLGIDQDDKAIAHGADLLSPYGHRAVLVRSNFREIRRIAEEYGFIPCDGIVFDLGVSSPQLDEADRGFSYRQDAPLDMRMDRSSGMSAAEWLQTADESELVDVFFRYGEEKFSRRIARGILSARARKPIETTTELAEIVKEAIPAAARRTGPHPARRVFQAIRIHINDELSVLQDGLNTAFYLLRAGGRLAVITFHSLEDRLVKQSFAEWSKGCVCPPDFPVCTCGRKPAGKIIAHKPVIASEAELSANPRSRSAKLRVIERLPGN